MNCPKCGEDWSDVAVVRNARREALAAPPSDPAAPLDVERLAEAIGRVVERRGYIDLGQMDVVFVPENITGAAADIAREYAALTPKEADRGL